MRTIALITRPAEASTPALIGMKLAAADRWVEFYPVIRRELNGIEVDDASVHGDQDDLRARQPQVLRHIGRREQDG